MSTPHATEFPLSRLLAILAAVLIWKVTFSVLMDYRHYFPPNFESDFLLGRESYFWGAYAWAFYAHLLAGPVCLLLGTVLVSSTLRRAAPDWHRRLGRAVAACMLVVLVPSGLWMSFYAETGAVAAVGLCLLALSTAACAALGWRAAVARRYAAHRIWMWRAFLLMCSTVAIRLTGGLATVADWDAPWLYPLSTWLGWLIPLVAFELVERLRRSLAYRTA